MSDFGSTLDGSIFTVLNLIDGGTDKILQYALYLFFLLATLELTWHGIMIKTGRVSNPYESVFKIVHIAVLFWLLSFLPVLSMKFTDSLNQMASYGLQGEEDFQSLSPTASGIFTLGMRQTEAFVEALKGYQGVEEDRDDQGAVERALSSSFSTLADSLILLVVRVFFYVLFGVLALRLTIAKVKLSITIYFGAMLYPFMVFGPTKFIGEKVFSAIVGQALMLAVITFTISLGLKILTLLPAPREGFDLGSILTIVFLVLLVVMIVLESGSIPATLLGGMPSLNAASFMSNLGNISRTLSTAYNFAKEGGSALSNTLRGRNTLGAAGRGLGRTTGQLAGRALSSAYTKATTPQKSGYGQNLPLSKRAQSLKGRVEKAQEVYGKVAPLVSQLRNNFRRRQ